MKLRTIAIYFGVAVLIVVLYRIFFVKAQDENIEVTPEVEQTVTVIDSSSEKTHDNSPESKLIAEFTAQIEKGDIDGGNTFYQRGIVYLNTEQYRSAIQDFSSTLRYVKDSPYAYYNRALAYIKMDDYKPAVEDLDEAIKLKPDFIDAYNARALANVELERYDEALQDYDAAIKLSPGFVEAYFNKGTLLMRQEKYADAKIAFEQAISQNVTPKDADAMQQRVLKTKLVQAYLNLAMAKYYLMEYDSALKDATHAFTIDPYSVDALKLRAEIYSKMGNAASAAEDTAAAETLIMQKMLQQK